MPEAAGTKVEKVRKRVRRDMNCPTVDAQTLAESLQYNPFPVKALAEYSDLCRDEASRYLLFYFGRVHVRDIGMGDLSTLIRAAARGGSLSREHLTDIANDYFQELSAPTLGNRRAIEALVASLTN